MVGGHLPCDVSSLLCAASIAPLHCLLWDANAKSRNAQSVSFGPTNLPIGKSSMRALGFRQTRPKGDPRAASLTALGCLSTVDIRMCPDATAPDAAMQFAVRMHTADYEEGITDDRRPKACGCPGPGCSRHMERRQSPAGAKAAYRTCAQLFSGKDVHVNGHQHLVTFCATSFI
jgi:hypothetical protein